MKIPEINDRIRQIIDYYTDRNVKKFAETINISQQTVNRLFNIDTRTGKYPLATTEILCNTTEMYVEIDARWLLTGKGRMLPEQEHIVASYSDNSIPEVFGLLREKDQKIEEYARLVGKLEAELENFRKKQSRQDVQDAGCAAVG